MQTEPLTDEQLKELPLSQLVERARDQLDEARSTLQAAIRKHGWKDRLGDVEGLMTCGILSLYYHKQEIVDCEIMKDDHKLGKHIKFSPRGIGRDNCPCCYVCGPTEPSISRLMDNLSGFVKTKKDGEELVEWFGGSARLDFREREPDYLQVKFGVCDNHLPNLKHLRALTSKYGVIREKDIEASKKLSFGEY